MTQSYQPPDYAQAGVIDSPSYSEPTYSDSAPGQGDDASSQATTDVAKDQASQLGQSASEAGQHVAGVAKDQAAAVASEAGRQAKDLLRQAQSELTEQASSQQQKVASGLRSIGDELHSMSGHDGDRGVATDLAKQAAGKAHDVASWLDDREPGQLVAEVRSFARQRPVAFLAVALGAGLVTARLARGVAGASSDDDSSSADATASLSAAAAQPAYDEVDSSVPLGGYGSDLPEPEAEPEPGGFGAIGLAGPQEFPSGGVR